jgi:hypothetical protein
MRKNTKFDYRDLEAIVSHPWVLTHKGDFGNLPGCAGLWTIRQAHSIMVSDIRRFLGYALQEEATPSDLHDRIADYLNAQYGTVLPLSNLSNEQKWVKVAELLAHGSVDDEQPRPGSEGQTIH